MYFSKIELTAATDAINRLSGLLTGDGYRLHQALWKLFEYGGQRRMFLYRRIEQGRWPGFYVVSAQPPVDPSGLWRTSVKMYEPLLSVGERLAFSLRANPVVTRTASETGKRCRHDVVMDAKRQLKESAQERPPLPEIVWQAGWRWLQAQAERRGFQVQRAHIDSYRQHRLRKPGAKEPIRYSTLDFDGLLTVTEPELFRQALYGGIGPAKGFGCGLLLIRRV